MQFDHDRLDVYRVAIEFVAMANNVVEKLPRGRGYLADQLQRAATSIPLNIAEGAGEFSSAEKARFYRMAKRSATESAAILSRARARARARARSACLQIDAGLDDDDAPTLRKSPKKGETPG